MSQPPENSPVIRTITVTPFEQNCSLLRCPETGKGAVVDPGGEVSRILAAISEEQLDVEKILITHGHIDHVGGVAQLAKKLGVDIEGPHQADQILIQKLGEQAQMFGVSGAASFTVDRWLDQGDVVTVGQIQLAVSFCPGHAPGHVVFHHAASDVAIVGDVLFQGSIGRTDLPGGEHVDLLRSIVTRLWPMGNDTYFYPGHGPCSTFGQERQNNPFVADSVLLI